MKFNDYVEKAISCYDANFLKNYPRFFATQLRPENCWCPFLAKRSEEQWHQTIDNIDVNGDCYNYYSALSLFVTYLLKNEPVETIAFLVNLKRECEKHVLEFSEILMNDGLFRGGEFYYSPETELGPDEFRPARFVCFLGRTPKMIPDDFKDFARIDKRLTHLVQRCLYHYADAESIEKMKAGKWDEINYDTLRKNAESTVDLLATTAAPSETPNETVGSGEKKIPQALKYALSIENVDNKKWGKKLFKYVYADLRKNSKREKYSNNTLLKGIGKQSAGYTDYRRIALTTDKPDTEYIAYRIKPR